MNLVFVAPSFAFAVTVDSLGRRIRPIRLQATCLAFVIKEQPLSIRDSLFATEDFDSHA